MNVSIGEFAGQYASGQIALPSFSLKGFGKVKFVLDFIKNTYKRSIIFDFKNVFFSPVE